MQLNLKVLIKSYTFRYLTVLVFIPLILVSIWFRSGLIMGGGEEGLTFYNPSRSLELSQPWVERATGSPNLGMLPRTAFLSAISFLYKTFHIPNFILQAVTYYLLLSIGIVSVFFLVLLLINGQHYRYKIAFISALFYLLNPFSISQIWGRSISTQYFAFALLPIAMLIFLIGLKNRQYIFAIFLVFASIIFSPAFGYISFSITFWLILTLIFMYWVGTSKYKRKDLLFGLTFMFLSFILWNIANFWWLQEYIYAGNNISDRLSSAEGNVNSLVGVSRNFTPEVIVRLLQKSYFSENGYYGKIYVSLPFQLISLLLPFFLSLGFVKVMRENKFKQFRFFVVLFILGLFISLGANLPLGWLFVWFFQNVYFLQPFRNPYEKFGLVYVLGYAPLFALGIVYFFQQRFKIWGLITILILTCGIFVWPIWTGKIFAGSYEKAGVVVPPYYQQLSNYLDKSSADYRVFMTPVWGGDGTSYFWGDRIFQAGEPMMYLLSQPAVSNALGIPYYYDFISNIRRYMTRVNLAPSLALLRAKYLVDRDDAVMLPESEKSHYKFLTTTIHPPSDMNLTNKLICQNMQISPQPSGSAKLICQILENEQNWQGVRYLHLEIKTDIPSNLDISILDQKGVRNRWDGRIVSEYQIDKKDWTTLTIPLDVPTEYSYENPLDYSHVSFVEILAYSKNLKEGVDISIALKGIRLDPGKDIGTNEFKLIETLGKLKVYEPYVFNSPPEYGSLAQISKVEDFMQLFQAASQKRDSLDQEGLLILSQNLKKDLSLLSNTHNLNILDKSKLSEMRYWIQTDGNSQKGLILLSKTFDPQWKVIKGVSKNELNGSFASDMELLKKSFLPESNHYVVNGYANLWRVDNENRSYAIVFIPQVIANLGSKISIFGVFLMTVFTIIWVIIRLLRFYLKK